MTFISIYIYIYIHIHHMVVGVHMGLMKETNWCGPIMSPGHQISLKGKKGKDRATDTEDAPHFAAMEVNWLTIYLLNTLG